MAPLILDEAADTTVYRFLSFLRLLMLVHPRVGADRYAQHLGLEAGLVPGWNAVHRASGAEMPVVYVFIGPEEGRYSEEPPEPHEQIHVVREDDLPAFEGSSAWRQVMQLSDLVRERRPQGIDPTWVQQRVDMVHALAKTPLRGPDESVDERIAEDLTRIRDSVNGPTASLLTFKKPIAQAVDDALNFRLTLRQASNVVGVLLARYLIKFPSPLDDAGVVDRVKKQIDHLISLTSSITRDRHVFDLGSYAQLSYVGLLWADTAILMAKQLAKRSEGESLSRWFERRALYVEEAAAHDLHPSILHPISLAPFGVIEYQRARAVGLLGRRGVYAGAGEIGAGPLTPEQVWPRVQSYSANCDRVAADNAAFVEFLSPESVGPLKNRIGERGSSIRLERCWHRSGFDVVGPTGFRLFQRLQMIVCGAPHLSEGSPVGPLPVRGLPDNEREVLGKWRTACQENVVVGPLLLLREAEHLLPPRAAGDDGRRLNRQVQAKERS